MYQMFFIFWYIMIPPSWWMVSHWQLHMNDLSLLNSVNYIYSTPFQSSKMLQISMEYLLHCLFHRSFPTVFSKSYSNLEYILEVKSLFWQLYQTLLEFLTHQKQIPAYTGILKQPHYTSCGSWTLKLLNPINLL